MLSHSQAASYEVRYEPPIEGDDTALNGITLFCYSKAGKLAGSISADGLWGERAARSNRCDYVGENRKSFLTGARPLCGRTGAALRVSLSPTNILS